MSKLVIVESPTKAKTISKFLEKDFKVLSSYGHIRDLPKSELGVDVDNDFQPKYVIPTKSRKNLNALKKISKEVDEIILATDKDREGEAIAWHITKALDLEKSKEQTTSKKETKRIVFHEITKSAIDKALESPQEIDINLVNAQQARRILDRLVGYKLSPLLWKKVMRGLSAGRVQSVALRLIVEREKEREKFKPKIYWVLEVDLKNKKGEVFRAELWKKEDKKIKDQELEEKEEVDKILSDLKNTDWKIGKIEKKERKRNPLPPFTTSTLQQTASHRLGFSAKQTMVIAQQLYEGIEFDGNHEGLITYMRTDSLNISNQSKKDAEDFIKKEYGDKYNQPRNFKTKKKGAQEAHEAIRPTSPMRKPESLEKHLNKKQFKLYKLIWQRFIASQMTPAVFDLTKVEIKTNTSYTFKSNGSIQKFDGFLKVWSQKSKENTLPELKEKEEVYLEKLIPERKETQPPARYSEATLVKELEENGIGRPSTYAPIMSTITERGYVEKDENRKFYPTEVGGIVNKLLVENFPKIVDVDFTADMEKDLDDVAEGEKEWKKVVRDFYKPFEERLEKKLEELEKEDFIKDTPTEKKCPKCGKPVVIKLGRFGKFYACSGFPECKHTEDFLEKIGMKCPECEGEIIIKRTKRGKKFYGCSRWPKCEFASWKDPRDKDGEKNRKNKK